MNDLDEAAKRAQKEQHNVPTLGEDEPEDNELVDYLEDPPSDSEGERIFWNEHGLNPGCFWHLLLPDFQQAPIEDVNQRDICRLLHSAVGMVLLHLGKKDCSRHRLEEIRRGLLHTPPRVHAEYREAIDWRR